MDIIVLGSGSIGARHVRLLQQMDPTWHITLVRHDPTRPTNPYGVEEVFEISAALDAQPDLAVIASPTALHIEQAIACADAGCDLFIEKPLGTDLNAAQQLIDTVDERGVITHVGCQLRFDPLIQRVRTVLEEDVIGATVAFTRGRGPTCPSGGPTRTTGNLTVRLRRWAVA
jgi:Predicted dehydrogenases and related proteins